MTEPAGFVPAAAGDRTSTGALRLVPSPVFLLSYMRSGSTLLRSILDSHTEITAPLELHLGRLALKPLPARVAEGFAAVGLDASELPNMLWDRVLWQRLAETGKRIVVDKTPTNTMRVPRIDEYWPDARFLVLVRHPVPMLESMQRARPNLAHRWERELLAYAGVLAELASRDDAHPVRYEDLTADPARVVAGICEFLGVSYEPTMLEYGDFDHGPYVKGLGDWSERITGGRVQPAPPTPAPDDVPEGLREAARLLGYL